MKKRWQFSLGGLLLLIAIFAGTSPIWMRWYEDVVIRSTLVPTDHQRFPRVSPFTDVVFRGGRTYVLYDDQSYQLLAINGVSPDRLLRVAAFAFGSDRAEKRVAEDLPAVLHATGMQDVGDAVQLDLLNEETGKKVVVSEAAMTRRNRVELYHRRSAHP